MKKPSENWVSAAKTKDSRALAKLLSLAENEDPTAWEVLAELYPKISFGKILGITGPPGVGKSTVVNAFIKLLREKGERVGVIAVDPVSPFTGGSVLGDRIRMTEHFNDPDVFIRSVSTRGKLGGLSLATREVTDLLFAFGYNTVIIETVGVGQSEVDIKDVADVVLLILGPEWGDSIQMLKAGILEVADIFAVHKKDKEGAENVFLEIQNLLQLSGKKTPVLQTSQNDSASMQTLFQSMHQFIQMSAKQSHDNEYLFRGLLRKALERELRSSKLKAGDLKNPYRSAIDFLSAHPLKDWLK